MKSSLGSSQNIDDYEDKGLINTVNQEFFVIFYQYMMRKKINSNMNKVMKIKI